MLHHFLKVLACIGSTSSKLDLDVQAAAVKVLKVYCRCSTGCLILK